MNTFQLTCFLAVAETLSFARAAESLHVTQPAVTQQIHSLEKELNVKLFKRTTRSVKITKEGSIFYNDAQHIVALSERAKAKFKNPYEQDIRILSLGCHSHTQLFLLPSLLQQLKEQCPNVHPRLQVIPFQHLYRLLDEDDLDAIIGFREPDSKKISAQYRELSKIPIVCVCSLEHPLSQRQSVTMKDLKNEKLILLDPAKAQTDAAQLQGQLMGGRAPSEFFFCESIEAAIILSQAGFGISILPDLFIPPELSLARIPIENIAPASFGIYYKSIQGNPPLRALLQIMRSRIEKNIPITNYH